MIAAKEVGNNVYLLTKQSLEHEAWPREHIDDFFLVEDDWNLANVEKGIAY